MRPAGRRALTRLETGPRLRSHCPQARRPSFCRLSSSLQHSDRARWHRAGPPAPARHQRCLYSHAPGSATGAGDRAGPSFARLNDRSLLAVTGRDAASFLQGLTTNSIPFNASQEHGSPHSPPPALYAAFLNAQGRLLQDALIYELPHKSAFWAELGLDVSASDAGLSSPGFLVEVDASQAANLSKSLRRYKLRSKVAIRQVEPQRATVTSIWGTSASDAALLELVRGLHADGAVCRRDDRAPHFGFRSIARPDAVAKLAEAREAPVDEYRLRRYLHSIPEGQAELPCEASLVHESDLDYMQGVDFRKGCYVGQELVIRTQHTGVVRKRILPAVLYPAASEAPVSLEPSLGSASSIPEVPYGTDIKRADEADASGRRSRSAGKWVANVGNVGLALVRLELMAGLGPTGERVEGWGAPQFVLDPADGGGGERLGVKAFVPSWWDERRVLKAP